MGTHPIFESDFDCLTDVLIFVTNFVQVKKQTKITNDGGISGETGNGKTHSER